MKSRKLAIALAAALLSACSGGDDFPTCSLSGGSPLAASAWPKFRGDLRNTGRSGADLSGFDGPLSQHWKVSTLGTVAASPAIGTDGTIYIGSSDGRIYALNPSDGSEKWKPFATNDAVTSAPAIDAEDRVFVGSNDTGLYILKGADGTEARTRVPLFGMLGSPSISAAKPAAGVVFVGAASGGVFAVCPNGVARWSSASSGMAGAAAVASDGTVYVARAGEARAVTAHNPDDGAILWTFTATAPIHASPVVADDGTVFVADSAGYVFAVDPATGSRKSGFAYATGVPIVATPAIGSEATLYVADTGGVLAALEPATGAVRWTFQVPGGKGIASSPAVSADGTVVFGADDGLIYGLNGGGEVRWSFATGGPVRSSPAIAGDGTGTIYVGSDDGAIYALRP